jgi:NAD+ kinase
VASRDLITLRRLYHTGEKTHPSGLYITVVFHKEKRGAERVARVISSMLAKWGAQYELQEFTEDGFSNPIGCDALIVLGGDGTILASIHALEEPETPVLAISFGRGGYLADVGPEEAEKAVTALIEGRYYVERLMRLQADIDGEHIGEAVNEAYISNQLVGKVVEFDLYVDNLSLQNLVADGLILSTPLGSTGYNSSLGGPLVDEELELIIATPVAPITNLRPLIFSSLKKITVACRRGPFSVLIDGGMRRGFKTGSVEVTKARHYTVLIRTSSTRLCERRIKKRLNL